MGRRAALIVGVVATAVGVCAAPAAAEEVTAIDEAQGTLFPLAIADARVRAEALAKASGLQLGDVQAVEEYQDPRGYGPGDGGSSGTFGPGQFCGTTVRSHRVRTRSGKLVRRRVKTRRCFFPDVLVGSVEVTYSASRAP